MHAPASLFGKADSNASQEDIAKGIIYMVLQTIGGAAVLSALNGPVKDFVLIGNLTKFPQCHEVFSKYGKDIWGAFPYSTVCGIQDGDRGGAGVYQEECLKCLIFCK